MVKTREVTRAEFARLAGVSEAAITKAAKGALAPAVTSVGIDAAHPAASLYLAAQVPPLDMAEGVDELYEEALAYSRDIKRLSVRAIEARFKIPRSRCQRIVAVITAAGIDVTKPGTARPVARKPVPVASGQKPCQQERAANEFDQGLHDEPEDAIEIPAEIQSLADLTLRELVNRYGTASRFEKWLSAIQKIEAIQEKRLANAETQGLLISKRLVKTAVLDVIDGVFTRLLTDGSKTIASRAYAIAKGGGELNDVREMVDDILGSLIKPAKRKMQERAAASV